MHVIWVNQESKTVLFQADKTDTVSDCVRNLEGYRQTNLSLIIGNDSHDRIVLNTNIFILRSTTPYEEAKWLGHLSGLNSKELLGQDCLNDLQIEGHLLLAKVDLAKLLSSRRKQLSGELDKLLAAYD